MHASIDLRGLGFVALLFGGYLGLWRAKRVRQLRLTGVDPEVLGRATRPLQRYFAGSTRAMTVALVTLTLLHGLGVPWPGLLRLPALESAWADHAGLALGLAGLLLCSMAQHALGSSWRVGIDEEAPTPLVQSGLYAHIRNPTYLGLLLVNAGLWLIWPTVSVAAFTLVLFVLLEVQVRCEEEHLEAVHGEAFRLYRARTSRYIPLVY